MHIKYVDGLKGFCALLVVFLHYLMGFVGNGYTGWQSGIPDAQKLDYFWANFPLSAVINSTFILQIFFTLVAFLPAWHFFNKNDVEWVKRQAIIRYFRFVPYTLAIIIISYITYLSGGYFNQEVGDLINLRWISALMVGDFSWSDALFTALLKCFLYGDSGYVAVLWCMHIIFLGSYISYASILFFASCKRHMYIYTTLVLLFAFILPWSMVFVGGIMIASIACAELKKPSSPKLRKIVGVSTLVLGVVLGMGVDGISIDNTHQDIIKNCAALLVTFSIFYLDFLQKFFQNAFLVRCGEYGFSIIITHSVVMLSISSWMFLKFHSLFGYNLALVFTFILSIIPLYLATIIFAKIMDPICIKLSSKVYNYLR